VSAFLARERPDFPRRERRDDGGFIEIIDVAAAFALLVERDDRASLTYDLAARHLDSHARAPFRSSPPLKL
jgi:hypothetical protein